MISYGEQSLLKQMIKELKHILDLMERLIK